MVISVCASIKILHILSIALKKFIIAYKNINFMVSSMYQIVFLRIERIFNAKNIWIYFLYEVWGIDS